ncbi:MAG: tRNA (guanosine(37)-N1)-methyltransferase TrmD [Actinomycetota bacterium]
MRIDVFSIFPEMVDHIADQSVIGRGRRDGHLDIRVHDLRQTTTDVHQTVDDAPFGGGAGMVMKPEPLFGAVELVDPPRPLFYLSPSGRRFDQDMAHELAGLDGFSLLCGRYEGIDERVRTHLCDGEISVGDVVLAGGEVAAALIIEAVGRLVPGVLGNSTSIEDESFANGLLEYPHFTRPADFRGWEIPAVLRSGDHGKVERWRLAKAIERTARERPDLLEARGGLSDEEREALAEFGIPVPQGGTGRSDP